jgi:hypothetical protein
MRQRRNNERLRVDRSLAAKVGIFNALGLIITIASPMIVDPRLTTHVQYGARHYSRWLWSFTVLSAPVFLATRSVLADRKVSSGNYLRACLPLLVPGGLIAIFAFRPETPHLGASLLAVAYATVSIFTVACRQSREGYRYLADPTLEFAGRLERLKATVTTWQQISVYGMAAYMGFVAVALTVLWTITGYMVQLEKERFFLGESFIVQIVIYSVCVVSGPLHECFKMVFESVRQLSGLKEIPEYKE